MQHFSHCRKYLELKPKGLLFRRHALSRVVAKSRLVHICGYTLGTPTRNLFVGQRVDGAHVAPEPHRRLRRSWLSGNIVDSSDSLRFPGGLGYFSAPDRRDHVVQLVTIV